MASAPFSPNRKVDWTTPKLRITYLQLTSTKDANYWQVSRCNGYVGREFVDVDLPFCYLRKGKVFSSIINYARNAKLYAKKTGIFKAIQETVLPSENKETAFFYKYSKGGMLSQKDLEYSSIDSDERLLKMKGHLEELKKELIDQGLLTEKEIRGDSTMIHASYARHLSLQPTKWENLDPDMQTSISTVLNNLISQAANRGQLTTIYAMKATEYNVRDAIMQYLHSFGYRTSLDGWNLTIVW